MLEPQCFVSIFVLCTLSSILIFRTTRYAIKERWRSPICTESVGRLHWQNWIYQDAVNYRLCFFSLLICSLIVYCMLFVCLFVHFHFALPDLLITVLTFSRGIGIRVETLFFRESHALTTAFLSQESRETVLSSSLAVCRRQDQKRESPALFLGIGGCCLVPVLQRAV